MSLALTPISDAWSGGIQMKKKPPQQKKVEKNVQKVRPQNVYNSPQMQMKILNELGMLQQEEPQEEVQEVQEVQERQIEVQQPQIGTESSLNINITNPFLVNMFRPYSNEYIEMIIMKCVSEKNNDTSQELIDTVETIYLMVSILLVLVVIDIVFKMKH